MPVLFLDLRPGDEAARADSRERFAAAATADGRLIRAPVPDALRPLLAGGPPGLDPAAVSAAHAALADIDRARRGGDCRRARELAWAEIERLAGLQAAAARVDDAAAGEAVVAALAEAYGHAWMCAHEGGDVAAGLVIAARMERLGAAPPAFVPDEVRQAYPALDAAGNTHVVEVAVTTEPAGAEVWIDHRPVGTAPATALVAEGPVLVAAASLDADGGRTVVVDRADLPAVAWGEPQVLPLALSLSPRTHPWQAAAAAVARWRSGVAEVDGRVLGTIMSRIGVRFTLVLTAAYIDGSGVGSGGSAGAGPGDGAGDGAVAIWALASGQREARRVGTGSLDRPDPIATRIALRAQAEAGAEAEPEVPLLREQDLSATERGPGARRPWWVYATIIGAVAATAALILAPDLGDERQHIELRWP
ncbi:PEGA domain-containing protein [Haliangium sp.]|uniref:PEGA domain-containing protein n=1 Tax=Haliangium sp. TaxID=2663208 RepID=UPI003D0E2E3B